jgi:hypothetical protein
MGRLDFGLNFPGVVSFSALDRFTFSVHAGRFNTPFE